MYPAWRVFNLRNKKDESFVRYAHSAYANGRINFNGVPSVVCSSYNKSVTTVGRSDEGAEIYGFSYLTNVSPPVSTSRYMFFSVSDEVSIAPGSTAPSSLQVMRVNLSGEYAMETISILPDWSPSVVNGKKVFRSTIAIYNNDIVYIVAGTILDSGNGFYAYLIKCDFSTGTYTVIKTIFGGVNYPSGDGSTFSGLSIHEVRMLSNEKKTFLLYPYLDDWAEGESESFEYAGTINWYIYDPENEIEVDILTKVNSSNDFDTSGNLWTNSVYYDGRVVTFFSCDSSDSIFVHNVNLSDVFPTLQTLDISVTSLPDFGSGGISVHPVNHKIYGEILYNTGNYVESVIEYDPTGNTYNEHTITNDFDFDSPVTTLSSSIGVYTMETDDGGDSYYVRECYNGNITSISDDFYNVGIAKMSVCNKIENGIGILLFKLGNNFFRMYRGDSYDEFNSFLSSTGGVTFLHINRLFAVVRGNTTTATKIYYYPPEV